MKKISSLIGKYMAWIVLAIAALALTYLYLRTTVSVDVRSMFISIINLLISSFVFQAQHRKIIELFRLIRDDHGQVIRVNEKEVVEVSSHLLSFVCAILMGF